MRTLSSARARIALLVALWCAYPALPAGPGREVYYDSLAALALAVGLVGVGTLQGPSRRGMTLVVVGFGGWVCGDVVFSLEQYVVRYDGYPAPSDAVYLASYAVIAAGLLLLVRGRQHSTDPTPVLDASIVAVGFGMLVTTFVVAPISADSTLSLLGRFVASSYPIADVLLLGVLVRLWSSVGSRTPAFRLLVVGLGATMVADVVWNVTAMTDPQAGTPAWLDMLWLLGYLTVAAAASSPSAAELGSGAPGDPAISPRRRLVALGCGLVLPGLTLFLAGLLDLTLPWRTVSGGAIVLSVLVLARMSLLVRTVEVQAVQLAALARSDGLTGAPNRRTWDHELGRAFQHAEDTHEPLSVAMLDLDHFKRYNDSHGHQAGDLLLREAVAAWTSVLRPGELLARYGGEEFGLLLPGAAVEEAAERLQLMLALTPGGQTFSAGVVEWTPGAEPAAVVELADRALYDAKHAGRARVRVARAPHEAPSTPAVRIALQPIVDLGAGTHVGHEALSRVADGDTETVFAHAHRAGHGQELEAAAVRAAFRQRPESGYLSVNVSIGALLGEPVQAALPTDLRGVVVEITEQADTDRWDEVAAVVADLRARGAFIAVDDWGRGYSTVDRVMRLRPDVVKLDRSLLTDLEDPAHQQALRTLVDWARSLGAKVCAEGVEDEGQLAVLRTLGIDFGQGYLFGRPAIPVDPAQAPASVLTPERG